MNIAWPISVAAWSEFWVFFRTLLCWDCWFESHRELGCLCLVSVVCCQVKVSATGWSLIQRSRPHCVCTCVCVLLSVIRCSEKPLLLQWLRKKERKKERKSTARKLYCIFQNYILNLYPLCVLYIGQAFRCSPENAFYIFNEQIYFIIWYLLYRASLM